MLAEIRTIYRDSLKPADSWFNLYLARPLAAGLVAWLRRTRLTPNQVTLISLAVMLPAVAALALIPGAAGLVIGVVLVELSYLFDCADGQLARLTGRTSVVGAQLDFLMDELKAYLLVAGVAARWHHVDGGGAWALYVGVGALVVVGSALSVTKFVRSPEYAEATGTRPLRHGEAAGSRSGPLWPVEALARLISQYPVCLPVFAVFDALTPFLYAYGAVHLLYLGKTALTIILKLGRFAPPDAPKGGARP